jgi:hypothetical protein
MQRRPQGRRQEDQLFYSTDASLTVKLRDTGSKEFLSELCGLSFASFAVKVF